MAAGLMSSPWLLSFLSPPPSNSQRTLSLSSRNQPVLRSKQRLLSISIFSCSAGTLDPEPIVENPDASSKPGRNPDSSVLSVKEGGKDRRKEVRIAWEKIVRWSRSWRSKTKADVLERTTKVVVLGGGSFGTAMAAHLASKKDEMEVSMLVRDAVVCRSINETHFNW